MAREEAETEGEKRERRKGKEEGEKEVRTARSRRRMEGDAMAASSAVLEASSVSEGVRSSREREESWEGMGLDLFESA